MTLQAWSKIIKTNETLKNTVHQELISEIEEKYIVDLILEYVNGPYPKFRKEYLDSEDKAMLFDKYRLQYHALFYFYSLDLEYYRLYPWNKLVPMLYDLCTDDIPDYEKMMRKLLDLIACDDDDPVFSEPMKNLSFDTFIDNDRYYVFPMFVIHLAKLCYIIESEELDQDRFIRCRKYKNKKDNRRSYEYNSKLLERLNWRKLLKLE